MEAPWETIIVEAVVNYFSKPEFRELFIYTEYGIQMGVDNRRADIVLLDKAENFIAIIECKRTGVVTYGPEQLKAYLCATDTQFGIFANSTAPNDWEFYENLRRNQFKEITRDQFEARIVAYQPIESIREEKKRLITEVGRACAQHEQKTRELESSYKRLDKVNEKIEQANVELTQLTEKIYLSRKESTDLKEEIEQNSQHAEILKGLKLKFTHDNLKKEINLLGTKRGQLKNEIGEKEQQRTDLSKEVNLLMEDRDKLEKEKNRIRSEQKTLKTEKKTWKDGEKKRKNYIDYLKQITANLKRSIKHKAGAVRDLDRLSRLDELEAAFAQESIYEQIREELERLDKLESEIKSKQQLARQDQERHAAYKRNKVETNRKIQQLAQVSQEKESILKQLRVVINQLKAASSEQQASQIEENRRKLVRDFRKRKCIRGKLIKEISRLKEVKSELEEEIGQAGQQLSFEENEMCPAYVQIQLEIDKLKTEKSKIEAKIGHQIFLRLP